MILYFYNYLLNAVILDWFELTLIKLRFSKTFSNNYKLHATRKINKDITFRSFVSKYSVDKKLNNYNSYTVIKYELNSND